MLFTLIKIDRSATYSAGCPRFEPFYLKTKLPVKRSTHLKVGADEADFSDMFIGFTSGDRIDPKWFVVPK